MLYYAPSIFTALGTSSNTTSLLATGVVGALLCIATVPAVLYIDKFGRKPVMMFGAVGMGFVTLPLLLSLPRMKISGLPIRLQAGLL